MTTKLSMRLQLIMLLALLSPMAATATQYCGEVLSSLTVGETTAQSLTFTAAKTADLETTFVVTSATSTITDIFAGSAMQNLGGGITAENTPAGFNEGWTQVGNEFTKTITWTTYPTDNLQIYMIVYRDNATGGADIMGLTITDIDVSAPCVTSTDVIPPVMVSATIDTYTATTANILVAATDNETTTVTRFRVTDMANGITNKNLTATNGTIVIDNLMPSTTYNLAISAVDAAINVSENSITVNFTTPAIPIPTVSAPIPTANNVIAIFSDAYTAIPFSYGSWGQSTIAENYTIDQDNIIKLTDFNYLGFELGTAQDMSNMTTLHVDVWSANETLFQITPIWGGEKLIEKKLVAETWNSIDIPLTEYDGINKTNIFQLKIVGSGNYGTPKKTVYIDNIYFYSATTALAPNKQNLFTVHTQPNALLIDMPHPMPLAVFTTTGICVYQHSTPTTKTQIPLPKGMYILKAGTQVTKVTLK